MRSARRDLWLCSPSTQEIASTMFDLPQPLGPTMQVIPLPLKVICVFSQNDLKPTSSTLRSLSKFAPLTFLPSPCAREPLPRGRAETNSGSSVGADLRQKPWWVAQWLPSRPALGWRIRCATIAHEPGTVKPWRTECACGVPQPLRSYAASARLWNKPRGRDRPSCPKTLAICIKNYIVQA